MGRQVVYPSLYDPRLLFPIAREENREKYGITDPDSLFCGYDTWHVYEAGFLTERGLPVTGIVKIVYPATTECIVESKSLKLYFFSLNMSRLGQTPQEGIRLFTEVVRQDLSILLNTSVEVRFFNQDEKETPFDFSHYFQLERIPEITDLSFSDYTENESLLQTNIQAGGELQIRTDLLRSNCKITGQPDWGSVFIHIKANTLPHLSSLLQYIVSLRNENHFHEEICEMIYKRLHDHFAPEILAVTCLYTRRGGIDICPSRANTANALPSHLINPDILTQKTFRQ